jgi:hypothetical protein
MKNCYVQTPDEVIKLRAQQLLRKCMEAISRSPNGIQVEIAGYGGDAVEQTVSVLRSRGWYVANVYPSQRKRPCAAIFISR